MRSDSRGVSSAFITMHQKAVLGIGGGVLALAFSSGADLEVHASPRQTGRQYLCFAALAIHWLGLTHFASPFA